MRTSISPSLAWAIVYTLVGGLTVLAQTNETASERKSDEAETQTEFAFNIFSDIAPILALFGEQFATQYLSQSFTWLDHIIFACVPLGIVTALSAAIRVQGAAWMRSFIGRARENRSAAELELMSSTSDEVCEIFNGKAIVRTMGRPKISEIVLLPEKDDKSGQEDNNPDQNKPDSSCGMYTLKAAADMLKEDNTSPLMCEEYRNPWFHFLVPKRNLKPVNDTESNTEHDKPTGPFGPPNVQVNVASGHSSEESNKAELFFAMAFASILQLGIVAIACVTVVHGPTRNAIGYQPPSYGLPSYVVGSFAIFTSMLICSHAIERSTVEHIWERSENGKDHFPMRLFWIQRAQTVSDQTFGSYIILGGAKRYILTSGRNEHLETQKHLDASPASSRQSKDLDANSTKWATVTFTGVTLGAAGFVVQFIGLRGLSYPVSLSHLGAILVMALVRALIRRRLGQVPLCFPVLEGRELDCLAYQLTFNENMRDYKDVSMNDAVTAEADSIRHWTVLTSEIPGASGEQGKSRISTTRQNGLNRDSVQTENNKSCRRHGNLFFAPIHGKKDTMHATGVDKENATHGTKGRNLRTNHRDLVQVRKRLGDLCGWKSDETQVALALAQGIESFLQAFLPNGSADLDEPGNPICWQILCAEPLSDFNSEETPTQDTRYVSIPITFTKSVWEVEVGQLEAVLSLWTASIEAKRISRKNDSGGRQKNEKSDWRRGVSSKTTYRRNLGIDFDDGILRRDISWWIGQDFARSSKMEPGKVDAPGHRQDMEIVIGFNGPDLEDYKKRIENIRQAPGELSIFSSNHLPNILAQHLLTSFMWAIVNVLPKDALREADSPGENEAAVRGSAQLTERSTSGDEASYPCRLTHQKLTGIVTLMESSGLASVNDILLCMIPALSWGDLLPNERMLHFMPSPTGGVNEWGRALQCYTNVLQRSIENEERRTQSLAHAVVVKTMDVIFIACDKAENDSSFHQKLKTEMHELINCLTSHGTNILRTISPVYKLQQRNGRFARIFDKYRGDGKQNIRFLTERLSLSDLERLTLMQDLPVLGFSKDHHGLFAYLRSSFAKHRRGWDDTAQAEQCQLLQPRPTADLFGWTPLHYAVLNLERGFSHLVYQMIQNKYSWDNRSERGLCVGPGLVHLAAQIGSREIIEKLLLFNLKTDSLDFLGHSTFSYISKTKKTPQTKADIAGVLLSSWENLEARDANGRTCLHWAAEVADKDTISSFLRDRNGYSIVDTPDHTGKTPLHIASQRGNPDLLYVLLSNNAGVHATDQSGRTALHYAAWDQANNTVDIMELLVKRGTDINCRDVSGQTPLHASIVAGKEDNALRLIKGSQGFSPDTGATDNAGATPLMLACGSGLKDVVEKLARMYPSNPFETQDNDGNCSLVYAARGDHGFDEILPIILQAHVNINTRNRIEATPLLVAIWHKKEKNALGLLEAGADHTLSDQFGKFPLHEAAWHNCFEVFEYMIKNAGQGDWINKVGTDHGYSTLSAVCTGGYKTNFVEALLTHPDINVNVPRNEGSPLHRVIHSQGEHKLQILKLLLKHPGIDLNMPDKEGRTPLAAAEAMGNEDIVREIKERLKPVA